MPFTTTILYALRAKHLIVDITAVLYSLVVLIIAQRKLEIINLLI